MRRDVEPGVVATEGNDKVTRVGTGKPRIKSKAAFELKIPGQDVGIFG